MYFIRKLKPDKSLIGLVPGITVVIITAFLLAFFGKHAAIVFLTAVFYFASLLMFIAFIRIGNYGYLVNGLFLVFAGFVSGSLPSGIFPFNRGVIAFLMFCELFFVAWTLYLTFTKKYKWRGREILELAAAPVNELGNGFTPRPRPSGKIEYSRTEIMAFVRFVLKNLIAMPYVDKESVIFVPLTVNRAWLYIFGFRSSYSNETWVAFNYDGNVTVHISKKDYYNYQDDLSFDQLCQSFANLFIEFFELFKKGEDIRIIDRLDAVRMSPFS